ncbi:hypothetical protein FKL40_23880, partial [Klebsiella pneumoniae]|nr:hypothetical protein [Klebsiella pneumoniae]
HGDVLMWLMKTLLTSGCTNQRGAGHNGWRWQPDSVHSRSVSYTESQYCPKVSEISFGCTL